VARQLALSPGPSIYCTNVNDAAYLWSCLFFLHHPTKRKMEEDAGHSFNAVLLCFFYFITVLQ
jgi:hypothetical protein